MDDGHEKHSEYKSPDDLQDMLDKLRDIDVDMIGCSDCRRNHEKLVQDACNNPALDPIMRELVIRGLLQNNRAVSNAAEIIKKLGEQVLSLSMLVSAINQVLGDKFGDGTPLFKMASVQVGSDGSIDLSQVPDDISEDVRREIMERIQGEIAKRRKH